MQYVYQRGGRGVYNTTFRGQKGNLMWNDMEQQWTVRNIKKYVVEN